MFAMSLPELRIIFNPPPAKLEADLLSPDKNNPLSWRVNVGVRGHVTPQGRYSLAFTILNKGG